MQLHKRTNRKKQIATLLGVSLTGALLLSGCTPASSSEHQPVVLKKEKISETSKSPEVVKLSVTAQNQTVFKWAAFGYVAVDEGIPNNFGLTNDHRLVAYKDYGGLAQKEYMLLQFNESTLRANVVQQLKGLSKQSKNPVEQQEILRLAELLDAYSTHSTTYLNYVRSQEESKKNLTKEALSLHQKVVSAANAYTQAVESAIPSRYLHVEMTKKARQYAYLTQGNAEEMTSYIKELFGTKSPSASLRLKKAQQTDVIWVVGLMDENVKSGLSMYEQSKSFGKMQKEDARRYHALKELKTTLNRFISDAEQGTFDTKEYMTLIEQTKAFTDIPESVLDPTVPISYDGQR